MKMKSHVHWPIEAARALSTHAPPFVRKGISPVFRPRFPLFLAMLLVGLMPAGVGPRTAATCAGAARRAVRPANPLSDAFH